MGANSHVIGADYGDRRLFYPFLLAASSKTCVCGSILDGKPKEWRSLTNVIRVANLNGFHN